MQFPEFGHYVFRGRTFFDKLSAIEAVRAVGDYNPDISFYFNDHAYTNATIEPVLSLAELYRARAQQLRDSFDYLILMYSGGADSQQVLMSFLKNNIHLDEVRTYYPLGFIERLDHSVPPGHPLDMLMEYQRVTLPGLKMIDRVAPQTKTRVIDTTSEYACGWDDAWLDKLCIWPKPNGALFNTIARNATSVDLQRYADKLNRKTAVIYGAEKPYLRIVGDEVFFFFTDVARVGIYTIFVNEGKPLFRPVMFFWGEPLISIKQAHVIKRAIEQSAVALAYIREHRVNVYPDTGIPNIDLGLIYPDWFYQRKVKLTSASTEILSTFIEVPVREIVQERRSFLDRQFTNGVLTTTRADDFLSMTSSALHSVGRLRQ